MNYFNVNTTVFINIAVDGLAMFKSNKTDIWPWMFYFASLLPDFRRLLENLFVSQVMSVKSKEYNDLLQFMFFSELKYLQYNSMYL